MPCQKALENIGKENKSMAVKIKKQPVTLMVDSNSNKKIPYEIIEKIEAVEK